MYNFLKKRITFLLPEKLLFKYELFFRYFYGIIYLGNKHKCNICNKKLKAFVNIKNGDLICPFCGSLSRNRRLWHLLQEHNTVKGNILHFSPSRSLYRVLKNQKKANYFSTDFEDEFLADYKFDITNINQSNDKFSLIICYHVLEHISDDIKAITELYRVLKPNGVLYVQTPYKEGNIYENKTITSPKERLKHFGQEDHVRVYSVYGLKERLENNGFNVHIKTFVDNDEGTYYGFTSPETVLVVKK